MHVKKKRISINSIRLKPKWYKLKTTSVITLTFIQFLYNELKISYFKGIITKINKQKQQLLLQNTLKGEPIKLNYQLVDPKIINWITSKLHTNIKYRIKQITFKTKFRF